MTRNLDRFDQMEIAAARSRAAIVAPTVLRMESPARTRPARPDVPPLIVTSSRGALFVDHMNCPMCGVDRIGITYQGLRASGAKIHEVAAHSPGKRRVGNGEVRCLGAGLRVVFVNGRWIGEPNR